MLAECQASERSKHVGKDVGGTPVEKAKSCVCAMSQLLGESLSHLSCLCRHPIWLYEWPLVKGAGIFNAIASVGTAFIEGLLQSALCRPNLDLVHDVWMQRVIRLMNE